MRAWRAWRLPGRWPDGGRRSTVARWTRRHAAPACATIPDLTNVRFFITTAADCFRAVEDRVDGGSACLGDLVRASPQPAVQGEDGRSVRLCRGPRQEAGTRHQGSGGRAPRHGRAGRRPTKPDKNRYAARPNRGESVRLNGIINIIIVYFI